MHARFAQGEVILALLFAALGVLWMVTSFGMPFWQGFAPQSGFVPFWYGVILTALAAACLVNALRRTEDEKPPIGKPLVVLGALAAGILGLELIGFGPAIFLLLLVLFAAVERLPLLRSALVAAVATAVLIVLFRVWLGVQLPIGPLGV